MPLMVMELTKKHHNENTSLPNTFIAEIIIFHGKKLGYF